MVGSPKLHKDREVMNLHIIHRSSVSIDLQSEPFGASWRAVCLYCKPPVTEYFFVHTENTAIQKVYKYTVYIQSFPHADR